MRVLLGVLLLVVQLTSYANVAVDEVAQLTSQREKSQVVKDEFKDYYFIYVFKSTCPHCKRFTPIIANFTSTYQIPIKSYSIDGGSLHGIHSAPMNMQLFNTLFTNANYKPVVPALFLVNKVTNQAYAVVFGEAGAVELASRLEELLKKIKEKYDA